MKLNKLKKTIYKNRLSILLIIITIIMILFLSFIINLFFPKNKENKNHNISNEINNTVLNTNSVNKDLQSINEDDKVGYTPNQIRKWVYGDETPPKRMVFITIDDGPSKNHTPRVLDILKRNNIKATFFYVTNFDFESKSEVVKRTFNEGHSIGLHSNSHDYDLLYPDGICDSNFIIEDLKECKNKIAKIIPNFETNIMRFPGGSFSWENNKEAKERIRELGLDYVDWNIMTGDADNSGRDKSPEGIVNYVDQLYVEIGEPDVLVLLMHDPSYMDCTPDSLQAVIDYFKDKGYSFEKII